MAGRSGLVAGPRGAVPLLSGPIPPNKGAATAVACGGGGGKESEREEHGQRNTSRTRSRARRVKWAGSCAGSCCTGEGCAVHRVAAHITLERLWKVFTELKRDAAPGADGLTWWQYEQDLRANLEDLHGRVQSGKYRAKPVRRVLIPKPDGRMRPLGVATEAA